MKVSCFSQNVFSKGEMREYIGEVFPIFCYPASSWFLLHRMRQKPLRATVCFSFEHAQVCHAPCHAFDVSFICLLEVFVQRRSQECKFLAKKHRQKNAPDLRLSTVLSSLWSQYKA